MPRLDVFAAALRALDGGRGVAIASVTGVRGSTPRHLGARMAVADDGEQWGTIGGGRIEQLVVAAAQQVARGGEARVVRQHLVRDLAMCCGGSMEVAITPAAESRIAIARLAGAREPAVLVTPLDGRPLEVRPPVTGDPPAHAPVTAGGALIERVGAAERAIVFGLGHVARHLGPLLDGLGFTVIACDDGETGAVDAAPAWAAEVIESFDAREVEARLGGFSGDDYVLIVTRDHAIDQQLLEQLFARDDLGYLGMIGSRGKIGRFRKRLEAKGLLGPEVESGGLTPPVGPEMESGGLTPPVGPEMESGGLTPPVGPSLGRARWARLHAPIGLDIGAETPEEIAIAIAAELVACRRRGVAASGDWRPAGRDRSGDA